MPDLAPPRPFFLAGRTRRPDPPPSAFPFQAYPGNPDPLPARRRVSLESLAHTPAYAYIAAADPDDPALPRSGSLGDLRPQQILASSSSSASLYRASAAAPIAASPAVHPAQVFRPPFLSPASRPGSTLSWTPPVLEYANGSSTALHLSPSGSNLALGHRPPLPSTMLEKGPMASLVSLKQGPQGKRHKLSWWLTFACIVLGAAGAAILCYTGVNDAKKMMLDESQLCLVMNEDFSSGTFNDAYWTRDVQIDDRGFQISSGADKNLFVRNNELYLFPTLTRDDVPDYADDGSTYDVPGCTADVPAPAPAAPALNSTASGNSTSGNSTTTGGGNGNGGGRPTTHARRQHTNSTAPPPPVVGAPAVAAGGNPCKAITNTAAGSVINPVMSAKITTKGKVGIRYGRVEVVAKIASGDWLWPAIWMMPENNTYGAWPLSGEMDIMEARGNSPAYPAQGTNYVRSQLQYGLSETLTPITTPGAAAPPPLTKDLFGWFSLKRTSFASSFHTYVVEWDETFIRFWIDGRVRAVLEVDVDPGRKPSKSGDGGGGTFWDKGRFPATAQNKTTGAVVVVKDPWEGGAPTAPFDQRESSRAVSRCNLKC
ncbi:hypothetical protein C0992_009138 [Termitomyces sp. T32_za158]|nr:hypothetical protein C0992_009138 [Termitomyces sp. T32_za158]